MVKKCLFKQKIHPKVQKLQEFFVISNQNAQFITNFFVLITWIWPTTSLVFFIGNPSLVGEPPSGLRNSINFQIFITNYHSNKCKVRLLLANLKISLTKFSYWFPVWPYWLINFLRKLVLPLYAVGELKLGHSQDALPIFGSRIMCHHSGYPYINSQCSYIDVMNQKQ